MITVVTWLWQGPTRVYGPEHVRALARQVRQHLHRDHRFLVITDEPGDYGSAVVVPTPSEALAWEKIRPRETKPSPACYRRLWLFSEAAKALGDRVLSIDLDTLILKDLDPLIDFASDFVGWRPRADWHVVRRHSGSLFLLRTGTRTHVWDSFVGDFSVDAARFKGYRGSDQAWMSYCLQGQSTWPHSLGIVAYREISPYVPQPRARVVQFNGETKPWTSDVPWVQRAWAEASA